jgi:large subunit ribosomal protein L15
VNLSDLGPAYGSTKKRKRVGRGNGSGHGTTSGRGNNGQLSRSGGGVRLGFEGGQMPLQRRLPHLKGFKNTRKEVFNIVNVSQLEVFEAGATVDYEALFKKGLIMKKNARVKILGSGDFTKKITIKADSFSKSAIEKINKAGGKAEAL